jgi:hypothetical protein
MVAVAHQRAQNSCRRRAGQRNQMTRPADLSRVSRFFGVIVSVVVGLFVAAATLMAHHSFAAEYDRNKMVSFKGVVTEFDWMNPHVHCHAKVKADDGSASNWDFELGGPGALVQNGWAKTTLHVGDAVTVKAALAKNGSHKASARVVTLPDGKELFAASSADGGPNDVR